ncbi:MAG: UDP-N-acetylmuramate dehydrogenase [Lachnospiraceae bacterium]|nr:UDP-N-acetylmuramate dehydrogenase [Lachnospiraceae bacterium]
MDLFCDRLREVSDNVCFDEPMKRHTTFQVGGPADVFVTPQTTSELAAVIRLCREQGKPYFILGNGSNLLVSDKGYRGVVIHMSRAFEEITIRENRVLVGAGATLSKTAAKACEAGLSGLEFASGIPGTLGGAMVMNAGAYGGEMAQVVSAATVLTKDGEEKRLDHAELQMGYRKSCILPMEYIVTEVELLLTPGDREEIRSKIEDLAARRKEKQPLEYPSAGSTFKRPEGYFAGKLIMDAGLRGCSVGGACVSEKHCGFVVNRGGATAAEILELCRKVRGQVFQKFGVSLELEVRLLGEFDPPFER